MEYKKYLEGVVTTAPLVLLTLKHLKSIATVNDFLPYSTGFEIECMQGKNYNVENFKKIPDIIEVINDTGEQRYRIPAGIKGFICLYNICEQLKVNSELNIESGIHYHIDMTDCFRLISTNTNFRRKNADWILKELDTWNFKGTYNQRGMPDSNPAGSWARFSYHSTLEIRTGEMSFDYQVLSKRIIHCNSIVKRLKDKLGVEYKTLDPEPLDGLKLLEYIKSNSPIRKLTNDMYDKFILTLKKAEQDNIESKAEDLDIENIKNIINNRNKNK